MRISKSDSHLHVKAIAGTHVVLMALDIDESARPGFHGFAIKRGQDGQSPQWLRGIKYFKALVPNPDPESDFSSRDQPFQTFLWSDYRASPGTQYEFTIVALYGDLHAMEERYSLSFKVTTEPEYDAKGQGVWFNRGTIASHAFEAHFHNAALTKEMTDNVSDDGKLLDDETRWLSRGLAEACLKYINDAKSGEGLRVCAYEFTYLPVLRALKRAHGRGVDVQIVFHDTKKEKDANRAAIAEAGLPASTVHPRTRTSIPHNKFIVKLVHGAPQLVWSGSTNFTDTGFFGQTNVGYIVADPAITRTYLDYWTKLKDDPVHSKALTNAIELTPNPPNAIGPSSTAAFFSPRKADNMLDWYSQRIGNTGGLAMMTIPFNVAPKILSGLGKTSNAMRLVILEDIPTPEVDQAEQRNRGKLAFSNGAIIGKSLIKYKTGFGGAKVAPIPNSDLDRWFVDEELARPTNAGHVFFVHAKVLLIDPLSDDPLICSGSANFSKNSLVANDENMLLIRGDTRAADIYMTELDRVFRHFYARDVINKIATAGQHEPWRELDPTDEWIGKNYKDGTYKNNRRLLFFPDGAAPKPWSARAGSDPNPFADEDARVTAEKKRKGDQARARKEAGGQGAAKKTAKKAAKKKTAKKAAKKKAAKKKTAKKKAAKKTTKKKAAARKTAKKTAKKAKKKKSSKRK